MEDFDVCPACGQKLIKSAMRCIRCGQALITLEDQLARIEKLKKKEKDSGMLLFATLLTFFLAAGVVYHLFPGRLLEIISALFRNHKNISRQGVRHKESRKGGNNLPREAGQDSLLHS